MDEEIKDAILEAEEAAPEVQELPGEEEASE